MSSNIIINSKISIQINDNSPKDETPLRYQLDLRGNRLWRSEPSTPRANTPLSPSPAYQMMVVQLAPISDEGMPFDLPIEPHPELAEGPERNPPQGQVEIEGVQDPAQLGRIQRLFSRLKFS